MINLAVIIARAGSRGLANKSMHPLAGRPLLAWTIEHALGSRLIDHIALTTDGTDIATVGRKKGLNVYLRPGDLATDCTTIDAAARHGVECWEVAHGQTADRVAIMYANVALRPTDLTDRALEKLVKTGADSVQSVYPVGKNHPLWMRTIGVGKQGQVDVLGMYEPNRIYRRQELPPVYMLDAGAIAVTRSSLFNFDPAEPHAFLGTDRRAIVSEPGDVVDIDSELDICFAEAILAHRARNQRSNASPVTSPRSGPDDLAA